MLNRPPFRPGIVRTSDFTPTPELATTGNVDKVWP